MNIIYIYPYGYIREVNNLYGVRSIRYRRFSFGRKVP